MICVTSLRLPWIRRLHMCLSAQAICDCAVRRMVSDGEATISTALNDLSARMSLTARRIQEVYRRFLHRSSTWPWVIYNQRKRKVRVKNCSKEVVAVGMFDGDDRLGWKARQVTKRL